jgi:hypothetical protein
MFKTLAPEHKQHITAALDHIDGILGESMAKARVHLTGKDKEESPEHEAAETPAEEHTEHAPGGAEEGKYEGHENPGGHAGHNFGASKDQHGMNNYHAAGGGAGEGMAEEGHPGMPNMAKKKSGHGLGGFEHLFKK